jgi:hypothetical protein
VALVAAPWALAPFSPLLAILVVFVLVALSTLCGTIGDRGGVVPPIFAVPGFVTIGLVAVQFGVAVVACWYLTAWLGVPALLLVLVGIAVELPRWRWLRRR